MRCPVCGGEATMLPGALTIDELECLDGAMHGVCDKEIARRLGIGEETVHSRLLHAYHKLGVDNRTSAVVVCLKLGLLSLGD
jgi:DNA-binding NarL/FixJ family response regulator